MTPATGEARRAASPDVVVVAKRMVAKVDIRSFTQKPHIWQAVLLLVLAWCAHFLLSRQFGLYEDDYFFIGRPLAWSPAEFLQSLSVAWTWPQGRPLGYLLCYVIAYLGGWLGGLHILYVFAWLIQSVNAILLFLLLTRLAGKAVAWLGAVVFLLFPADTTQSFLMHSFGLHTSVTFLLLAGHAYVSGRRTTAYALSLGSLLTYETVYPVFLAVPLLVLPWNRRSVPTLLRHALIWAGMLAMAVVARSTMGESRIGSLEGGLAPVLDAVTKAISALALGPRYAMRAFRLGPQWTVQNWNPALTVVFVIGMAFFAAMGAWLIHEVNKPSAVTEERGEDTSENHRSEGPDARRKKRLFKLALTGLVMFGLAYAFSFTHYPPTPWFGRLTSVHVAASVGASVLIAALLCLVLEMARYLWARIVIVAALTAYLALLLAYRVSIQQGFVAAWANERRFWTSAVAALPDLDEGTVIIVPREGLPEGRFIEAFSWAGPLILQQLYVFPTSWQIPPRLFFVDSDWVKGLQGTGAAVRWTVPAAERPQHQEILPQGNVIVLVWTKGHVHRETGSIDADGVSILLKPLPESLRPAWATRRLYQLLIVK